MGFRKFIHRPQQVFLRKALFQVHLWVGLFLALYVALIGLSGSILVFREELQQLTGATPQFPGIGLSPPAVNMAAASQKIGREFPKARQTFLYAPRQEVPVYQGFILENKQSSSVYVHPQTGQILQRVPYRENLLSWIGQLHYFLLLGRSPGLWLNGIGAALLLVLCVSGLFIWWPGLRSWRRGFSVDFRMSWKRINFDSHNVVGFWTLSIVSFWAISGVYFAWLYGVLPDFRRMGVASQVMEAMHAWVQERDYHTIRFECQNQHRAMMHMAIANLYDVVGIRWDPDRNSNLVIFEKYFQDES